jgi:branched-chain amino acid aminotransferase
MDQPPRRETVSVNGLIGDATTAVVSVFDHGFLYGEGIYETLRTYGKVPFLLDRHLRRLRASAERIGLEIPQSDAQLTSAITATMDHAALSVEQYVRLLVTRGVGDLSYDPATCGEPTIVIIVKPHRENAPAVMTHGVTVILSSLIRNHPRAINPLIKSNNLLNNALAMQEAIRAGADEALMLNYRDEVAECAQSNFFLVRGGEVLTPPLESGLLEGVTRNFVFEVGQRANLAVVERVLRKPDLAEAEEMFITSTTREVLPVTRLDGRPVGTGKPGPVTLQLATEFRRYIKELTGA